MKAFCIALLIPFFSFAQDSTKFEMPEKLALIEEDGVYYVSISGGKNNCPTDLEPYLLTLNNRKALRHYRKIDGKGFMYYVSIAGTVLVGSSLPGGVITATILLIKGHRKGALIFTGISGVAFITYKVWIKLDTKWTNYHLKKIVEIYNSSMAKSLDQFRE